MEKTTPLKILARWREYVRIVYKAIKTIAPRAETYITGGVAENRLTVKSDIDILLVLPQKPTFTQAVELRTKILKEAERLGLPLYAPIDLHIISKEELRKYKKRGRVIPLDKI